MEPVATIEVPSRRFGKYMVRSKHRYATAGDMAAELFGYTLIADQWMARGDVRAYLEEMVGIVGE